MARINRRRRSSEEDTEPNMVPIMNMFMVLIPFLLMSASFFHIKAINTSVPVHAIATDAQPDAPEIKVTVIMEIKDDRFQISALSEQLNSEELLELETTITKPHSIKEPLATLADFLQGVKTQYPASDTMILIPDASVLYDEIVWAMDCARNMEQNPLFPNVVLSGSLG
jgi:biopolymer transport protein ExbD